MITLFFRFDTIPVKYEQKAFAIFLWSLISDESTMNVCDGLSLVSNNKKPLRDKRATVARFIGNILLHNNFYLAQCCAIPPVLRNKCCRNRNFSIFF